MLTGLVFIRCDIPRLYMRTEVRAKVNKKSVSIYMLKFTDVVSVSMLFLRRDVHKTIHVFSKSLDGARPMSI